MTMDEYKSAARYAVTEIKVRGSRFIAEALPVADESAAEEHVESVRRREFSASHHCTAFRIGADARLFRYNDDGEPSGTAGQPILRQIEGRNLTDTLVVVTRYFGGTKLGTGGLMRAYGDAAAAALDAAGEKKHVMSACLFVSFDYEDTSPAMLVLQKFDAEVVQSFYTETTRLEVAVPRSRVDAFEAAFVDALGGRGSLERAEQAP